MFNEAYCILLITDCQPCSSRTHSLLLHRWRQPSIVDIKKNGIFTWCITPKSNDTNCFVDFHILSPYFGRQREKNCTVCSRFYGGSCTKHWSIRSLYCTTLGYMGECGRHFCTLLCNCRLYGYCKRQCCTVMYKGRSYTGIVHDNALPSCVTRQVLYSIAQQSVQAHITQHISTSLLFPCYTRTAVV